MTYHEEQKAEEVAKKLNDDIKFGFYKDHIKTIVKALITFTKGKDDQIIELEKEVDYIKKQNDKIMELTKRLKHELDFNNLLLGKYYKAIEEIIYLREACGMDKPKQGAY